MVDRYCIDENGADTMTEQIVNELAGRQDFAVALVGCGLAESSGNGKIRIKGAKAKSGKSRISWKKSLQENGKKGGRPPSEITNRLTKSLSISPPLQSTIYNLQTTFKEKSEKTKTPPVASTASLRESSPGQVLMAEYKKGFKEKYGAYPRTGGKEAGIVKRLVKDHPVDGLCLWIQGYFQMPDPWFQTKCHDLVTFEQNIGKIAAAVETGKDVPGKANWWDGMDTGETT